MKPPCLLIHPSYPRWGPLCTPLQFQACATPLRTLTPPRHGACIALCLDLPRATAHSLSTHSAQSATQQILSCIHGNLPCNQLAIQVLSPVFVMVLLTMRSSRLLGTVMQHSRHSSDCMTLRVMLGSLSMQSSSSCLMLPMDPRERHKLAGDAHFQLRRSQLQMHALSSITPVVMPLPPSPPPPPPLPFMPGQS